MLGYHPYEVCLNTFFVYFILFFFCKLAGRFGYRLRMCAGMQQLHSKCVAA